MKRLQISIEPELDAAVERRAEEEGLSKAEVIRRCVREEIRPLPPIEEDPLFKMFGTVSSDRDDTRTIDEVVYGLVDRDYP
ncbi:MAG TPA: CopG family transcriptional regulator [Solirubrobacterales bacterium]|jgi:metal-responsive CopG/Arc/MetJ family transcriptional regulator|nr:CopG family transcriptional regulator [Solirubrobacterales bacterium]